MNDNDPKMESSALCRSVTQDGLALKVMIYRLVGEDNRWSLEVVNPEGTSTVWDDLFATDIEAFAEFHKTLEAEGIRAFLDANSPHERMRRSEMMVPGIALLTRASAAKLAAIPAGASPADIGVQSMS